MATTHPTQQPVQLQDVSETPQHREHRLTKRRANYHKKKHLIRPKERKAERERYWHDPDKARRKARETYQRNRVQILKQIHLRYANDPKRQTICKQRTKDYARRHPEKLKAYKQRPEVKMQAAEYVRRSETRMRTRERNLRKYGITLKQYDELAVKQDNVCAICRQPEQGNTRWTKRGDADHFVNLKVDHCHATGRVRGLLCARCNLGLGSFHDDPALLAVAIDYLKA